MTENMKSFLETVSKNEELCAKINTMTRDEVIVLSKELGSELTDADFEQPASELSDDELTTVAGGQVCGCAIVGGGNGNTNAEETCYCFAGGGGVKSDLVGGGCRCWCVAAGYGDAVGSVPYPTKDNDG